MAKSKTIKKPKKSAKEKSLQRKEQSKKRIFSKQEKQLIIVAVFMAVSILFFIAFFFIRQNIGVFTYYGIKFQKTSAKGLIIYQGKISLQNPAGIVNYNLFLRNDPRLIGDIPENISEVVLRPVGYISFEPEISQCYGSSLAAYEVASFLGAFGMQLKGATTSHEVAIDEGIPERDCADAISQTVVVLKSANETSIEQRGDCYIIYISNCKVIESSEGFILSLIKNLWNFNTQ